MPDFVVKEEIKTITVTRDDILDTISKNVTDREILDDIIEHIEYKIRSKASNLIPVVIPHIGSIVPNENKLDAIENSQYLRLMKKSKSEADYKIFNKEFIKERFKLRGKYKTRRTLTKWSIRSNKARATRLLKTGISEVQFELYFYFFAHLEQVSCNYE